MAPEREREAEEDAPAREESGDGLAKARYCAPCASWRVETPCPICGRELAVADESDDDGPAAPTRGAFTLRLLREVLPSLPGAAVCAALVTGALLSQAVLPFGDLHWPGRIVAGFIAATWLVERARSARSGGADHDIVALGGVLLRALYLLPVLLGILTLNPAAIGAAALLALLGPLFLAALAGEEPLGDLRPGALVEAFKATDHYARFAALTTVGLTAILVPLAWDGGDPVARGVVIGLGAAVAGTAAGLSRRSAEHTPEGTR